MRFALVLMIAASAVAAPAFAQPGAARPQTVQTPGPPPAPSPDKSLPEADTPSVNREADAALAMSIRLREEAEQRIARIACAAGDAAKCEMLQAAKAPTPTATPAR